MKSPHIFNQNLSQDEQVLETVSSSVKLEINEYPKKSSHCSSKIFFLKAFICIFFSLIILFQANVLLFNSQTHLSAKDKNQYFAQQFLQNNSTTNITRGYKQYSNDHYSLSFVTSSPEQNTYQPMSYDVNFIVTNISNENIVTLYAAFIETENVDFLESLLTKYKTNQMTIKEVKDFGLILIKCELSNENQFLSCDRPLDLNPKLFLILLKSIRLYAPNLSRTFYEIDDHEGNLITQRIQPEKTVDFLNNEFIQTYNAYMMMDESGDISKMKISSSLFQTVFRNSNQTQNIQNINRKFNSTTDSSLDIETGKIYSSLQKATFLLNSTDDQGNFDKGMSSLLKNVFIDFELSLKLINSNMISDQDFQFLNEFVHQSQYMLMLDPLNSYSSLLDIQSPNENKVNPRRNLASSPDIFDQTFEIFNFDYGGINFLGNCFVECFWDKNCYAGCDAIIGSTNIDLGNFSISVGDYFQDYNSFLFLKTLVLDKIVSLTDLIDNSNDEIFNLILTFTNQTLASLTSLESNVNNDFQSFLNSFQQFSQDVYNLTSFSSIFLPDLDENIELMVLQISNAIELQIASDYNTYYDFLETYVLLVEVDIVDYQSDLIHLSDSQKSAVYTTISNILTDYTQDYNALLAQFNQYSPIISTWSNTIATTIVNQLTNSYFNVYPAITANLSSYIISNLALSDNAFLINEFVEEMTATFNNFKNALQLTYNFEQTQLTNMLNTYKNELNSISQPTNTLSSPVFEEVESNSIFLNNNALNNLFSSINLSITVSEVVMNITVPPMNSFLYNFETLFSFFLNQSVNTYQSSASEFNATISALIAATNLNISTEISDLTTALSTILNELNSAVSGVIYWFNLLNSDAFSPTEEEFEAISSTNVFTLGTQITDVYASLSTAISNFESLLSNNNVRLLESTNPNHRVGPVRRLDFFSSIGNFFNSVVNTVVSAVNGIVNIWNSFNNSLFGSIIEIVLIGLGAFTGLDVVAGAAAGALAVGVTGFNRRLQEVNNGVNITQVLQDLSQFIVNEGSLIQTTAVNEMNLFVQFFDNQVVQVQTIEPTLSNMANPTSNTQMVNNFYKSISNVEVADDLFVSLTLTLAFEWNYEIVPGSLTITQTPAFPAIPTSASLSITPWIFSLILNPNYIVTMGIFSGTLADLTTVVPSNTQFFVGYANVNSSFEVSATADVLIPSLELSDFEISLEKCLEISLFSSAISVDGIWNAVEESNENLVPSQCVPFDF